MLFRSLTEGLVEAIETCGRLLEEKGVDIRPDDENELTDTVRTPTRLNRLHEPLCEVVVLNAPTDARHHFGPVVGLHLLINTGVAHHLDPVLAERHEEQNTRPVAGVEYLLLHECLQGPPVHRLVEPIAPGQEALQRIQVPREESADRPRYQHRQRYAPRCKEPSEAPAVVEAQRFS